MQAWQKRRSRTGQAQQNRWSIRCRWTTKASGPRWQEEEIRWLQQKKHKMLCFCCTAEKDAGDIKRQGKKLSLDSGDVLQAEEEQQIWWKMAPMKAVGGVNSNYIDGPTRRKGKSKQPVNQGKGPRDDSLQRPFNGIP
ncbi:hypothetical protein BHM03_00048444 [Ensete ventricosum]|nr:hypothetical protein BHM03_00048444 [Ensete ventricosum]